MRTGDSVVEACASRTISQFHRLRRDLLALMPRLSMSVMRVEALGGGRAPPALPALPAKSLRRQSVRTAAARDVATLSRDGTARRLATKGPELTKWIRDVLAILRHRLGSQPSVAHAVTDASRSRVGQGAAAAEEAERAARRFSVARRAPVGAAGRPRRRRPRRRRAASCAS